MRPELLVLGCWAIEGAGATSSFLFENGAQKLLIDTCPSICRQLHAAGKRLTEIDTVILTHCHGDHLAGFAYAVFKRTAEARSSVTPVRTLRVVGQSYTLDRAKMMLECQYPDRKFEVNWETVADGDVVDLDGISVEAIEVDHTVPTLGFLFKGAGFSFAHSGDTRPVSKLHERCSNVDLFIIEVFGRRADFASLAEQQKHLLADEAAEIAAKANARKILIFHMHIPYQDQQKMEALLLEMRERYAGEIIPAADFLRVEI